ncbi:MAG TPA: hypothetical protein VGB50_13680 [Flavobacterium sp.]|jgi:hypothetical protein
MYTKQQAEEKVREFLTFQNNIFIWNSPEGEDPEIKMISSKTTEHEFGWVFYYHAKDPENPLIGNGPLIIDKKTLDMYEMSTALPEEHYIKKFLKNKNSLAQIEKDDDGIWDIVNLD